MWGCAMSKQATKLTKIQEKALNFIKASAAQTGTAPTLRELCSHMGYSAIGSAQDLVSALRKKGFLYTPDRQAARSLILTQKALALYEPELQSSDSTFIVNCIDQIPSGGESLHDTDVEKVCTMRMSIAMFQRPYPASESLFGLKVEGDRMIDAGIMDGDWIMVEATETADMGDIVLVSIENNEKHLLGRLMKDRNGWYLRAENVLFPVIRLVDEGYKVLGKIVALQRVIVPKVLH